MGNDGQVMQNACVELYSGWATSHNGGFLYGRVFRGRPLPPPAETDGWVEKLGETLKTLDEKSLDAAHVRLSGYPGAGFFTVDECGYLKVRLPSEMPPGPVLIQAQIDMDGWVPASAHTTVQVWKLTTPPLGVISDIDDTLTPTEVTDKIRLIRNTLFHNTYSVKVFDGAGEALAAVVGKGEGSRPTLPLFYLSGSPWALHERIADAFDRLGLPHGVTILRRYFQEPLDPFHFKHPHLLEIVDANPGFRWMLCGDSGEKDPEVYHTLMEERPDAVEAVFIHNVTNESLSNKRFSNFSLFKPDNFALFDSWTEVFEAAQRRKLGLCGADAAIVQA